VLFDPRAGTRSRQDLPRRNAELYLLGPADRPSAWATTYFEFLPARRGSDPSASNEVWLGRHEVFDVASCRKLLNDVRAVMRSAGDADSGLHRGFFRYQGVLFFFAIEQAPGSASSHAVIDVFEISDDPQRMIGFQEPSRMVAQYRRKAPN
jgi:hypothetical protein